MKKSGLIKNFINKFLVFHKSFLRLWFFEHILYFIFTHGHSISAEIIPHLTHWNHPRLLRVKHFKTFHQFLFHGDLSLLVNLNNFKYTMSAKKSAKSTFDETKGLSDLSTLSPSISITKISIFLTFLFWYIDIQYSKNSRYIFSKYVAILLFVIAIKYFSIFFKHLGTNFRFEFDRNLLFSFANRLHCQMDYFINQKRIEFFSIGFPDITETTIVLESLQ